MSFPPSLISGAPPRDCDGEGIYFYFLNASRNASSSNFLPNVKNNGAYKVFPPGKKFLLACRVGDEENNAVDFSPSFFLKVGWPIQHNGERDKKAS